MPWLNGEHRLYCPPWKGGAASRDHGGLTVSDILLSSIDRVTLALRAQLKKCHRVARQDRDDLVQDVLGRMLERYESFDPARGTVEGWALGILQNLLKDRIEASQAQKRRPSSNSRGSPVGCIEIAERDHRLPSRGTDPQEIVDQQIDMPVVLAILGDDDRGLALRLTRGTMSDAAAETGGSRTAQYRGADRIRAALELGGYGPQE
jgi:DNA-directed RNA polymerase specialized sigma24 family protein